MRIIAGAWRGRVLRAPVGSATRPTADRVRQAVFDILMHAPWAGPDLMRDQTVLDGFAGTGALGLEALSRGAARAVFMEQDSAALAGLRANIAACRAEDRCRVVPGNTLRPPRGAPCALVFLDPPYGQSLVPRAVSALTEAGWIGPETLIAAEFGRAEELPFPEPLVARAHGAAHIAMWRAVLYP